jgi:hypothetical protein
MYALRAGHTKINSIRYLSGRKNQLSRHERRRSERFNLGIPLTVQWTNGSEQPKAHTVTHDVSSGGVYFFLPEAIPDGAAVEVEMILPTQITLGPSVRVRCQGHIQRCVLKPGESAGIATMIEKYEFLSGSKNIA